MSALDVITGQRKWWVECRDAVSFFDALPTDCIDLVIGSPPYADARTYGIDAVYTCQEWVDWMLTLTESAVRVCKGLVVWVCAGVQRDLDYWPCCEGLAWEWWKRGHHQWRPCIWWKVDADDGGTGVPGSGGKQWLRNDWEYCLAFKREGWLPYADPLVVGRPPVYTQAGGDFSHRGQDGKRANSKDVTARKKNGVRKDETYVPPDIVNPGNCIVLPDVPDGLVVKARVGGGHMGSKLCHKNEAPYPQLLPEFFVRSFCPVGGIVSDCFSGSGTTLAASIKWQRRFVGCDLRQSQVDLSRQRAGAEMPMLFVD